MVARVWNLCPCADLIGYPSRFVLIRSFRWLGRGKRVGDSTIKGSCAGLPSQLRPPGWRRVRGCVKIDFWVRQRSIHAAAAAGVTCLCTLTTRMLGENKMKGNPEKMGTRESRPLQSRAAQVYGLNLVGEFDPVPAIVQSDHGAGGSPVTIRRASLPADVTASLAAGTDVINSPGLSVQRFAGIGTFMVENGTDITIDAAPDVSAHSLKLWLLGPVLAAVLYQRGLVPLHGNGIDLGGSSVIVSGNSGAGKSTLTCDLLARGHRLISDDVCVVRWPGPVIAPGIAEMKLWADTLDRVVGSATYPVPGREGKFHVGLYQGQVSDCPPPLSSIWVLNPSTEAKKLSIESVRGAAVLRLLSPMSYRTGHIQGHDRFAALFAFVEQLAKAVRVYTVDFPEGSYFSDDIVSAIERHG
ncbi:MAG TPA: hypothetical protein DIW43_12605 [Spongiibacteraceae bacterium]|nr:hypothetical protein [Spongiibacteraceae bacterium]HCS28291.1 hypothetical protein [Spongiibacteraceae bacterium]